MIIWRGALFSNGYVELICTHCNITARKRPTTNPDGFRRWYRWFHKRHNHLKAHQQRTSNKRGGVIF